MPRTATAGTSLDETFSSLRLIGGHDVLPDRLAKYPDFDIDGGARIRKSLVVIGDAIFQGEATVDGNLTVLGNTIIDSVIGDICGNVTTDNIAVKSATQIAISSGVAVAGNVDTTGVFSVNSTQVVGAQQSDVGNLLATDVVTISGSGADPDLNANFANIVATLNGALDVLRTHGLMG